jgi:hypothetical protein
MNFAVTPSCDVLQGSDLSTQMGRKFAILPARDVPWRTCSVSARGRDRASRFWGSWKGPSTRHGRDNRGNNLRDAILLRDLVRDRGKLVYFRKAEDQAVMDGGHRLMARHCSIFLML